MSHCVSMPPAVSASSCVFSGYFTLYNGTIPISTRSFEYSEIVIYDTVIKATSGPSMRAKLMISGRHTYPDESVVCIVAKGGPSRPYGFFLRACNILSTTLEPPLYREVLRCNRISATGVIVSTFKDESEDILFELQTVTRIDDSVWNWTMRWVFRSMISRTTSRLWQMYRLAVFARVYSCSERVRYCFRIGTTLCGRSW